MRRKDSAILRLKDERGRVRAKLAQCALEVEDVIRLRRLEGENADLKEKAADFEKFILELRLRIREAQENMPESSFLRGRWKLKKYFCKFLKTTIRDMKSLPVSF